MYPGGDSESSKDYVSIFLVTACCTASVVRFGFGTRVLGRNSPSTDSVPKQAAADTLGAGVRIVHVSIRARRERERDRNRGTG